MPSFENDIQRLVDSFVARIAELANRAAIEGLQKALGGGGARPGGGRRSMGAGRKRAPEILEKMQEDLLGFVAKNPGLRIEQINKQLGTRTKELALPIRKLLAGGALKSKGKKRSTVYFATGKN
jgi:hypothetical protein